MQWPVTAPLSVLLCAFGSAAYAQNADPDRMPEVAATQTEVSLEDVKPPPIASDILSPVSPITPTSSDMTPHGNPSDSSDQNVPYHWLDKTRQVLYDTMWHSAEHVDRWFGSVEDDTVYEQLYGSISPALIYTQYDHLHTQLRFNMNIPLPQADNRFHAVLGRFDPNEFVTERDEPSGAIQRTYGPPTEDQTIFGIGYHEPAKQGGRFDAGLGVRIALPMDPYIKGSYVFERGASETGLFSVRETLFWQHSEGAGATSRLDLERIYDLHWLARFTASATRSQTSMGVFGYSSILLLRGFPSRRAVAIEVGFDGQTKMPVPLHDYGLKVAYRQGILRRWLIMEIRTSLDWPKDFTYQHRSASLGIGLAFEMLFGKSEFLARPVTF